MKRLTAVLEKDGSDKIAGYIHTDQFLLTTVGATEENVFKNLRELIDDYITNEGADDDHWRNVKATDISFDIEYDLTSFFILYSAIEVNAIAKLASIDQSLMHQYVLGNKTASATQVIAIQAAFHQLGERLMNISLVTG